MRKPRVGRLARVLPALLAGALGTASQTRAAQGSPWEAVADKVFRPIANNGELPNAIIPLSMTEDGDGFLWLGGIAGLLRWDGYQFRQHASNPALPGGLHDLDVWVLHRDAGNRLWAGMASNGLARYDPAQGRMVCVPLAGGRCGTQHVWAIDDDGEGGLWIATSVGLFRLHADGKLAGEWHRLASPANGPPDEAALAVLRDHRGVVWVGTRSGLFRFDNDASGFTPVALGRVPAGAVSRLIEDAAGRIWVGTRQLGAFVLSDDRRRADIVPATAPPQAVDIATEVTALLEVAPGRVWIGTYGRGIVEVDGETLQGRRIVHDPFVPRGLNGDAIQSLYRDRSGLVWVATEDGLSEYDPGASALMTFFGSTGRRDGIPGGSTMALLAMPDGALWAGLQGEGFVVLTPTGRRATGLPGHRVFGLAPAPGGGVLLGTDGGLFLADPSGQHLTRLVVPHLDPTADVRVLHTAGGIVWLGGRDGGLWQLHIDLAGQVTVLGYETAPRLTNATVEVIGTAPDGRLAVGTDSGLNLLDPGTHAIERIYPDPVSPSGLDGGFITAFVTDRHGRLWVGTATGLDIWEKRDAAGRPLFRRLGAADGLPNASIDSLLVDRQGLVWASTDAGLAVIDPDTLKVRAFQRAEGLAITNYWDVSAAVTVTGEVAFGGIGGMTMVRPGSVPDWTYRPPVRVTALRVGGKAVSAAGGKAATLLVPSDANSLAVEFAALDFSEPSQNRYSYRLAGFDAGWQDTDATHRVAAYTNLPPGQYTLLLRGSNRNGIWTEPPTALQVRVVPAWFQTLWFRLFAAVLTMVAVFGLVRGSNAIMRRRQRDLERVVADRTSQLSASQVALQRANTKLEMRVTLRTHALAERTKALESSEARFRAWFAHSEDAVFVVQVKPDGRFVYEAVSAAIERVFGVNAAAYPGCEPRQVFPAEAAERVLARYRIAAKGEPIRFESHLTVKAGQRILDTWIVPVRDPVTGQVERLIGASRDTTERRKLEARLAQAQKLQALGGLAGGIAHDFNNILQAVAGAALLIEQAPTNLERVQRLARSTIAAAERGASITKRLLAFARSDNLRVETMNTAEVLEGLCEVLTYTLGGKIKVHAALAPNLPPLLADRGQLETALVNLGTNARDAMAEGGVLTLSAAPVTVAEGTRHSAGLKLGPYVRIDVADTGTGMDAATLTRAIEPFFTTKPQGHGTGLGLALVKGFAEQSGGGMTIQSVPGAGTTVSLWLRQAVFADSTGEPAGEVARRVGAASGRILIVDDDELVRETIVSLLEGVGFSTVSATCGADAIALIEKGSEPDAIVCDLSMPGMNGMETIRRARALLPDLPSFLLTGYAGERAALGPGDNFTLLSKPISADALIAQIEAGLAAQRH